MDNYTLIAYLKGALNREESTRVEEWISLSADNRKLLEDIYLILFVDERLQAKNEVDVERAFDEFRRKNLAPSLPQRKGTTPLWRRVASIAAIFVALLVSCTFVTLTLIEKNTAPFRISTKLGERAHVTLPDGTGVWLNAYSSLAYKKSFFSRERKAELSGEAYFEVAHNNRFPFIVSNHNSEIKVLGTKFNVRCNDDENYISTTLMQGSILFSNAVGNVNVKLAPSQELTFDKTTHQIKLKELKTPEEILGWIDGKLLFENASMAEIANVLERHYNVKIHFDDEEVKQERFNAEFEMADNIYQILSILELTNKLSYRIDKRDLFLSSPE